MPCYAGFDIAEKMDITAAVRVFLDYEEEEPHYYVFSRLYLPEERINDAEKKHYRGWFDAGDLIGTDGEYIDFHRIRDDLLADQETHGIDEVAYDKHNAAQLAQELYEAGLQTVDIPQNVAHLSEPMKWLEAMIVAGRIHHDGNPVMSWMIGNVVAKEDANGNVFPRKEQREKKIDGPVALIMAMSRAMVATVTDDLGVSFG
jgi:phage terminase large subunit-like protein